MSGKSSRIVGFAETPIAHESGLSAYELAAYVLEQLIATTGIAKDEINGFCTTPAISEGDDPFYAAYLAEVLGLQVDWLQVGGVGGASFLAGVAAADRAIRTGECEICVVIGADAPSTRNLARFRAYRDEFQSPAGVLRPPTAFGLLQNAYETRYGDPAEALAKLVMTQRQNALVNDNTCPKLKRPILISDYFNARKVSDPLRLLDSVMYCDGANAILVMEERTASRRGFTKGVRIAGYAERTNHLATEPTPDPLSTGFEVSGMRALKLAGLKPVDIGMLQLYDDFSIALLLQLEQIGFCSPGQGTQFVLSHDLTICGELPLNTGGGQLSMGQPGVAGGGLCFVEGVRQMLDAAPSRQVENNSNCLVTGIGVIPYARPWMMSNAMVIVK